MPKASARKGRKEQLGESLHCTRRHGDVAERGIALRGREKAVISKKTSAVLLLLLTVVVAATFSLLPRIPQSQTYHSFADRRSLLGIPNVGDVVSNVPFGVVGIWGLWLLLSSSSGRPAMCFLDSRERWPYAVLFIGLLLTAFGSSYYSNT